MTGLPLPNQALIPNISLKNLINEWLRAKKLKPKKN